MATWLALAAILSVAAPTSVLADTKVSTEQQKKLRRSTPSEAARDSVNPQTRGKKRTCPALGDKYARLEADHIVPFKTIIALKDFELLSCNNQGKVINYLPNFIGLGKSANSSKGTKDYKTWVEHKKRGTKVAPAFRAKMMKREQELLPELEGYVQKLLGEQPKAGGQ
jgi:Ni/Co efflux regulator RcnB